MKPLDDRDDFGTGGPKLFIIPLRGYRYFLISPVTGKVTSANRSTRWYPGEVMDATCDAYTSPLPPGGPFSGRITRPPCDADQVPGEDCNSRCGFYGWYHPRDATRNHCNYGLGLTFGREYRWPVMGVIQVHGKIIPGRTGFRAKKARLIALTLPTEAPVTLSYESEPATAAETTEMWDTFYEKCRQRYTGVIDIFTNSRDMVKEYPPQDVSNIRPK